MNRFDMLPSVVTSSRTGSRVIAPSTVTPTTDEDFVLLVTSKSAAIRELSAIGYRETTDTSYEDHSIRTMRSVPGGWPGYEESQKLHNLILVEGSTAYKRWVVSTHLAKELGLTDKRHRIMLFSAIKSGGLAIDDEAKIARQLESKDTVSTTVTSRGASSSVPNYGQFINFARPVPILDNTDRPWYSGCSASQ